MSLIKGIKRVFSKEVSGMDIANYVINQTVYYEINDLTNLKLQKIMYLISVRYIKTYDKPLFEEKFKAWRHGQICKSVYNYYRGKYKGGSAILIPYYDRELDDKITKVIHDILEEYGKTRAWDLVQLTNKEGSGWEKSFYNNIYEISYENMKDEDF